MPVTTTTIYGSKTYEDLVLSHTPTAVFGPYVPASNSIDDLTNRDYLKATLAVGASYSKQIPFFALASENYTFNINSSNKISITENSSLSVNTVGVGKFSQGDERLPFAVEFLLSKNYNRTSNQDFARFGIYNSQANAGLSYNSVTNEFYLNIYSSDGYIIYRSSVSGYPIKESKHIVINFKSGRPEMYINMVKASTLIDQLPKKVFFSPKISGRTVAEFSCSDNSQNLLISMISFYSYALSEQNIASRYYSLLDVGNFDKYISKIGSPLLNEIVTFNQKLARNDQLTQDFYGTNIYNTYTDPYIKIKTSPNFNIFSLDNNSLGVVNNSGSYSVASTGGFSLMSSDYISNFTNDGISIKFAGIGTGRFTSENSLLFVENSSVGDFYIAIDSASSKLILGTGSSTILTSISASVSQKPSKTINISFSGSTIFAEFTDGSGSFSYAFSDKITTDYAKVYLFNRYYTASTGYMIAGGNQQLDFNETYANSPQYVYAGLTTPTKNSTGSIVWNPYQYREAEAWIALPIPEKTKNYFMAYDSDNIKYTMYINGASSLITNESVINIPSSSSYLAISASMAGYYNSNIFNSIRNTNINRMYLYNFTTASYSAGSYPALLTTSSGVINHPERLLNVYKQNNIGFLQIPQSIISISKSDTDFDNIGQIDLLIGISDILSTSTQFIIDNNSSASMALIYSAASNTYLLNFSGMTASVNGENAISGSTTIQARQHYFIQSSFTTPISDASAFYLFSKSDGTASFSHSFDKVSVFPYTASYAKNRYGQVFGRRVVGVSDDDNKYLMVQSSPDSITLLNKNWQLYTS